MFKYNIIGGDPVRGDEEQVVRWECPVDIPDFTIRDQGNVGEIGIDERSHM